MRAETAEAGRALLAGQVANPFAFVLLDCSLPGEGGLAFLQALRSSPTTALLPAVVFTASINPRDRDAFYAAGANAYHVKMSPSPTTWRRLNQFFVIGCPARCCPIRALWLGVAA